MNNRLLTMTLLVGATLFGYAQKGEKLAKDYKSPALIAVQSNQTSQDGKALLREKLSMTQAEEMLKVKEETDQIGFKHDKYQHFYKGVKVFGSEYTIHSKNGQVSHLTGNFSKIENVNVQPDLSEDAALNKAKEGIEAQKFIWEEDPSQKPQAELIILDAKSTGTEARLTYKFEVISVKPYQRYDVFIDAKSGETLMKYSKIHFAEATGTGATRYSGSQTLSTDSYSGAYRLRDYSRGNGVVTWDATTANNVNGTTGTPIGSSDYTDNNNNWTAGEFDNADKDDAGLEAHFGAMATYDFFYTTFGRNSYNGSGATINSHVNTDIEGIYGYPSGYNDNAFWTGSVMVYGKGNSLDPLTTVDITGHEIGHAFMEYTANLVYAKESGAMNESFSDIWGTCVENYTNTNYGTTKDLWNLGTEIGQTFRSMSNPNAHGQPDTHGGTYWVSVTNCSPNSNNDQCGVHTNSGVGNHMFYTLTVGKSGTNDNGDSYSVSGIGIDKAAAINWRAQSQYLSTNSDYDDWRTYAIQSAVDLYGAGSAEEIAVTNAWYAVGVGAAYQAPAGCVTSPLTLTIKLDNYPEETSWTVKNSSGSTVASGGTYGSQADGSTVTETISGLTAGDYTFTINDSYGDGICCSYGSGNYSLTSGSTTVVSGGSFGSSETTNFCVEGGADTQAPTAPTSLSASNVQETTLTLSWNASSDNVGVTGYNVYQGSTNIGTVTSTTANITGLSEGTSYTFSVTAEDAAGNESGSSNTVNATTQSSDNTAPSVPTGLSASGVGQTSFTLSWNASSDNVGVTGYDVYQNGSFLKSSSGTSTSITGLSAGTTYAYRVSAKDAAGNTSAQSSALNVTTDAPNVTYCSTGGNNSSYEWIDKVQLGSINNNTGANGGYGNFTAQSTSLALGSTTTVYFSAGFSGSTYSENWRIWIDFNQDGDFTDSGEQVVTGTTSNGNTYNSTITVPGGASLGATRMRVSMVWNATPSSCGSFSYGEVEDYTVNITSSSIAGFSGVNGPSGAEKLGEGMSTATFSVYPNPAQDVLSFNTGEFKNITSVRVIDLGGKEVINLVTVKDNTINVSSLKQGLYLFEITTEKGKFDTKFLKQ